MQDPQPNDPKFLSRLMGVLRLLENTSELNTKKKILMNSVPQIPEFRTMLLLALDPYRKYGIQQFPSALEVKAAGKTTATWYDIEEFLNNCRLIWSGDHRKNELRKMLGKLDANDRELLRRILLKDLRCGVGATLVNKVFPQLIPEFGIMLASPVTESIVERWETQKTKLYGQPKENGDRMAVMIYKNYTVEAYTRKGHRITSYRQIESSLSMICQQSEIFKTFKEGAVFDGEVILGDFWKTRGVKKKSSEGTSDAVYHAFDLVPLEDWRKNISEPFSVRNRMLARMSNEAMFKQRDNVRKVPTFPIVYDDDLLGALDNYRDTLIKHGKEGLIIRPDLVYNWKTRSSMYKHKVRDSGDFMIVRVEPGEPGKKHAHHAGKIVVDLGDGVECRTGITGTVAERDRLWKERGKLVGKIAEVEFSERTQNKEGKPKLQFPVFIKVREDKS